METIQTEPVEMQIEENGTAIALQLLNWKNAILFKCRLSNGTTVNRAMPKILILLAFFIKEKMSLAKRIYILGRCSADLEELQRLWRLLRAQKIEIGFEAPKKTAKILWFRSGEEKISILFQGPKAKVYLEPLASGCEITMDKEGLLAAMRKLLK